MLIKCCQVEKFVSGMENFKYPNVQNLLKFNKNNNNVNACQSKRKRTLLECLVALVLEH